jgi:hypothetical protein
MVRAGSRTSPAQYWSAMVMSVPPPSCTFRSTSTGEPTWSERSTTWVSKSTSDVFTAGSSAKIDAMTAEKIADSSIDPD